MKERKSSCKQSSVAGYILAGAFTSASYATYLLPKRKEFYEGVSNYLPKHYRDIVRGMLLGAGGVTFLWTLLHGKSAELELVRVEREKASSDHKVESLQARLNQQQSEAERLERENQQLKTECDKARRTNNSYAKTASSSNRFSFLYGSGSEADDDSELTEEAVPNNFSPRGQV